MRGPLPTRWSGLVVVASLAVATAAPKAQTTESEESADMPQANSDKATDLEEERSARRKAKRKAKRKRAGRSARPLANKADAEGTLANANGPEPKEPAAEASARRPLPVVQRPQRRAATPKRRSKGGSRQTTHAPRLLFIVDPGARVSGREWTWLRQALLDSAVDHALLATQPGVVLTSSARNCRTAPLLLPTGEHSARAMVAAMPTDINPTDGTGLSAALTTAANHLASAGVGPQHDVTEAAAIVLLTQGRDDCGSRPERLVGYLRERGVPTFVIGWGAPNLAHRKLARLAHQSGTTRSADQDPLPYYPARNQPELIASLKTVLARVAEQPRTGR